MAFSYSEITSRKNDKIIWACRLSDKKNRDADGVFITDGIKLLEEAVLSGLEVEKIFFTSKALNSYGDTLERASAKEYLLVSDSCFEKLTDEKAPQGVFAVIKKPSSLPFCDESISDGGFIILDDIQNPLNLGAIFRCAYSLGCAKIALSRGCADVYNPKTLRAAMGSIFKCSFYVYDDLCEFIERLKSGGRRVYCTHLYSDSLELGSFELEKSDSFVMGNEGHGVKGDVLCACTGSVIIPMSEGAESLNAATAAAIIIWEMNKSKNKNNLEQI